MSETYQKIASTMEINLTNVQEYIQKLQASKGSDEKINPKLEKLSDVVKYLNEELQDKI